MKKRILSLVLASILVAGMAGIVSTADNEVGDFATGTTTRIAEIDPGESTTEEIEDEPVYTTVANVEPVTPVRAQSIMFQSDSGYTTSASTNMIGGVELGKTAGDLLGALKNSNGVAVMRGNTALANEDARNHQQQRAEGNGFIICFENFNHTIKSHIIPSDIKIPFGVR